MVEIMNLFLYNVIECLMVLIQVNEQIMGCVLKYDGLIVEILGFFVIFGVLCEIVIEIYVLVQGEVIGFVDGWNLVFLDQFNVLIIVGVVVCLCNGGCDVLVGLVLLGCVIDVGGVLLDGGLYFLCIVDWLFVGKLMNLLV